MWRRRLGLYGNQMSETPISPKIDVKLSSFPFHCMISFSSSSGFSVWSMENLIRVSSMNVRGFLAQRTFDNISMRPTRVKCRNVYVFLKATNLQISFIFNLGCERQQVPHHGFEWWDKSQRIQQMNFMFGRSPCHSASKSFTSSKICNVESVPDLFSSEISCLNIIMPKRLWTLLRPSSKDSFFIVSVISSYACGSPMTLDSRYRNTIPKPHTSVTRPR